MENRLIEKLKYYDDGIPWYWLAYGEKCYGFAVVTAFPLNEKDEPPAAGTCLSNPDGEGYWEGSNGTKMMINSWIADIERQDGGTACRFIAEAYAEYINDK